MVYRDTHKFSTTAYGGREILKLTLHIYNSLKGNEIKSVMQIYKSRFLIQNSINNGQGGEVF